MSARTCNGCGKQGVRFPRYSIPNPKGLCDYCLKKERVEAEKASIAAKCAVRRRRQLVKTYERSVAIAHVKTEQNRKALREKKKLAEYGHLSRLFTHDERTTAKNEAARNVRRRCRGLRNRRKEEARRKALAQTEEGRVMQEMARRELCRRRLLPFIEMFHEDYKVGWMQRDVCERLEKFLQDVVDKRSPRLILNMPPRSGKSVLASQMFPAWTLGRYPSLEIIGTSYALDLQTGFSRMIRSLLAEPQFQVLFDKCRPDKDNQNVEGWKTTKGGGYKAAGVGGPILGHGAHIAIIDDPVKNAEEAESEQQRESVWRWYVSTLYTRLAPGGGVLIIQQRWHDDDLSGRNILLSERGDGDAFTVVKYPAIAVEDEPYRKKGEALHPERYDLTALNRIKRIQGDRYWNALYQQNPVPDEGDYFQKDMFKYYTRDQLPKRLRYYAAWDLAIGRKERNDWTVGITVGLDTDDNIWIVEMRRGRWDSFQLVEEMINSYMQWRHSAICLERGQVSMAIEPYLRKRIVEQGLYQMFVVQQAPGARDKVKRARAIQGRMRQGKVFFPAIKEHPGMEQLFFEMLRFPEGSTDDTVDALAWVGLMMTEMNLPDLPRVDKPKSWRDKLQRMANGADKGSAMTA